MKKAKKTYIRVKYYEKKLELLNGIEKTSVTERIFKLGCFYVSKCVVVTSRSELHCVAACFRQEVVWTVN